MNNQAYFEQAKKLYQSAKFLEGIEFIDKNINTENDFEKEACFLKALFLHRLYRIDESIKYSDQAIECKNVAALNYKRDLLSLNYNNDKFNKESIELFEQALQLNRDLISAKDYFNQGISYMCLLKHQLAISLFEKAIQLNSSFTRAYLSKANCFYNLKKYEEAIDFYSKVIELNPNFLNAYISKEMVLDKMGK